MMNRTLGTRKLFFCGLTTASLLAQSATPARPVRTPVFISPELANSVSLITPPPALDSKKMSKDIAEIYSLHRSASPKEIESANFDNKHEDIFAVLSVLGDKFDKDNMPALAKLWTSMANDQGIVVSAAKKYFSHPRPYDLDANIKSICGSKAGGPRNSYPSGHGTVGFLSAAVLGMMVPEKSAELHQRAEEYGHNRVVCGDHYAADIPASKEAALLVLGNMVGNTRFQKEFAEAKVEVRHALGL